MVSSVYGGSRFFRRSSGVVHITHGMVVVLMENILSLRSMVQMISFCMDAIFSSFVKAVFKKVFMVSMTSWFSSRFMVSILSFFY